MTIEAAIFDRLNTATVTAFTADRIYPTDPNENTDWPFCVYRVGSAQPVTTTTGPTGLSSYAVTVDAWARSLSELSGLGDAVVARLHGYRGGSILGSFLTDRSNEELGSDEVGDIVHGVLSFTVWYASAAIVPAPEATGTVNTGPGSVTLAACGHVLELDCSGLHLDGGPVTGGDSLPDQTGNANKFLKTDGTSATWATVPSTAPASPNNSIQFNNSGAFGGTAFLTWNGSTLNAANIASGNTITGQIVNTASLGVSGNAGINTITANSISVTSVNAGSLGGDGASVTNLNPSNLSAPVPITKGGTGQTTAAAAINALVPTQTSNAGKVLGTDGSSVAWVDQSGGSSPGADGSPPGWAYLWDNDTNPSNKTAACAVFRLPGGISRTSSLTCTRRRRTSSAGPTSTPASSPPSTKRPLKPTSKTRRTGL